MSKNGAPPAYGFVPPPSAPPSYAQGKRICVCMTISVSCSLFVPSPPPLIPPLPRLRRCPPPPLCTRAEHMYTIANNCRALFVRSNYNCACTLCARTRTYVFVFASYFSCKWRAHITAVHRNESGHNNTYRDNSSTDRHPSGAHGLS